MNEWFPGQIAIGAVVVIPESVRCRHEVLQRANQHKRKSGRTFRCTRVAGGTRVERTA